MASYYLPATSQENTKTKTMKSILSLIISLLFYCSISAQKKCDYSINESQILANKNLDFFIDKIEHENFTVYNNKSAIPKNVLKELDCITDNFDIANPGEKFQVGCIAEKNTAKRQLIFLAKSKDIIVMSYATGGFGTSTHFLFIKFSSEKIEDLWTGVGMGIIKHTSIAEIIKFIAVQRKSEFGLNTNIVYL